MENILEPPEVEKCPKNWPKLRNFESLSWLWKTRFGLLRVFWSLSSLLRFVMSWFDVRWKALVSGDLLNTLSVIISPVKKFLEPWSWKMPEKLTKTQKFRKSQLALKNKIWSLARFLKLRSTSLILNVTIWCALDNLGLGQLFKYLERYHITREKVF